MELQNWIEFNIGDSKSGTSELKIGVEALRLSSAGIFFPSLGREFLGGDFAVRGLYETQQFQFFLWGSFNMF